MGQDPQQQQQQAGGGGGGGRRGSLIRDINRHAAVVMDGMPASLPADASDAAALLAAEQPVSIFEFDQIILDQRKMMARGSMSVYVAC